MELIIVRHGQPGASPPGSVPADPALTELGRRQAKALGDWLGRDPDRRPDRLWTSPMLRARQTAAEIGAICRLRADVDDRLAEFDQGAAHYVPMEIAGRAAVDQVMAALDTGRWGEHRFDPEQFRGRVAAAFDDILRTPDAHRVVVVCHGGVINSYLSTVIGRQHGMFFRPRYTSISRVVVDAAGTIRIASLNEFPHWADAGQEILPDGGPYAATRAGANR